MRLSLLEVIVVVLVILVVLVAVRIIGAGRSSQSSLEIPERQAGQSSSKGLQIKLAGIVLILLSILLLLAGMSMFKWVLKSYLWAFILLASGLLVIFMSRKR